MMFLTAQLARATAEIEINQNQFFCRADLHLIYKCPGAYLYGSTVHL